MTSDKPIIWGAAAAVVVLAGALYWYAYRSHHPAQPVTASAPVASQPASAPASAPPAIEYPVPASTGSAPMPSSVDHSDKAFLNAISALPDAAAIIRQLETQNVIRRAVTTVDNLPRKNLPANLRLFKATPGQFVVSNGGGTLAISTDNYARYQPFVSMVKSVDVDKVAQIYFYFYPLFQTAFDDLGYADGYFNDHVISLINQLLATPAPGTPPSLVQPNVMYLYADPALESLSAGQKTLIRMGPANEAAIKSKLRELKVALLAHEHH